MSARQLYLYTYKGPAYIDGWAYNIWTTLETKAYSEKQARRNIEAQIRNFAGVKNGKVVLVYDILKGVEYHGT